MRELNFLQTNIKMNELEISSHQKGVARSKEK